MRPGQRSEGVRDELFVSKWFNEPFCERLSSPWGEGKPGSIREERESGPDLGARVAIWREGDGDGGRCDFVFLGNALCFLSLSLLYFNFLLFVFLSRFFLS